ncbi:MAG: hypothetical protein INQ03_03385 [Candidatus Heimdallarchaeota archaeon]|nr:hypothetical protein [Candidatus Heimdallarchaeota archaeon]
MEFKEKMLETIEKCKTDLRRLSLADGVVADDEKELIDTVEGKLTKLTDYLNMNDLTMMEYLGMDMVIKGIAVASFEKAKEDNKISADERTLLMNVRNYVLVLSNMITDELKNQ